MRPQQLNPQLHFWYSLHQVSTGFEGQTQGFRDPTDHLQEDVKPKSSTTPADDASMENSVFRALYLTAAFGLDIPWLLVFLY